MRAGLQRLHTFLLEANIQHVLCESPGTDHALDLLISGPDAIS